MRLVEVVPGAECDCISQALWLRNFGYTAEQVLNETVSIVVGQLMFGVVFAHQKLHTYYSLTTTSPD